MSSSEELLSLQSLCGKSYSKQNICKGQVIQVVILQAFVSPHHVTVSPVLEHLCDWQQPEPKKYRVRMDICAHVQSE